jgi:hypothetical protein
MYLPLAEVMWYSSLVYQIFPNVELPSGQFLLEKSSVNEVNEERVLLFELLFEFEFRFPFAFVLRFALRLLLVFMFTTRLLLSFVTLAITIIRTTRPIPRNTRTAPMPSSQGQTLRFCGAAGGIGDHWGGG